MFSAAHGRHFSERRRGRWNAAGEAVVGRISRDTAFDLEPAIVIRAKLPTTRSLITE